MKRAKPETRLQKEILIQVRANYDCVIAHVPNGGLRTMAAGVELKQLGLTAGYPDLVIHAAGQRTFFMELKAPLSRFTPTGRVRKVSVEARLNPAQKVLIPQLRGYGFPVAVVRSVADAESVLALWGIARRPKRVRSEAEQTTGF